MSYFSILELKKSDTAKKKGIRNNPDEETRKRLECLIRECLDPIRERWGKPIIVTSGYRCPELNAAVGGAPTSQHMKGEAADIKDAGGDNKGLFELIKRMQLAGLIEFDQLIDESNLSWIHISHKQEHNRREILKL